MVGISPDTKAILWDMDGTILHSFGILQTICAELAQERGLVMPSTEVLVDHFHGSLNDSIEGAFGGRLKDDSLEEFVQGFLDKQGDHYLDVEKHLIEDAVDLSYRAHKKGLQQAIVTNRSHQGRGNASPRAIVENTVLKNYIHHVIAGDDAGEFRKPHKNVVKELLESWDLEPAEVIVIGDQHVDAQLALNLGCRAILVLRDGAELAHAHKLDDAWQKHVEVVASLDEVMV